MSYLDEVVKFIEKNTGGVNLAQGSEYSDPFTGRSIAPILYQTLLSSLRIDAIGDLKYPVLT